MDIDLFGFGFDKRHVQTKCSKLWLLGGSDTEGVGIT